MKKHLLLPAIGLLAMQSANGAATLINGDFSTNDLTGWTTSGTGSVSAASGAAVIQNGGNLFQDFAPTSGDGLVNFTASFTINFGAFSDLHRIRFEGNNGADKISFRYNGGSIEAFNGGSWLPVITGLMLATNTDYTFTMVGQNFGQTFANGFGYEVSIADGSGILGSSGIRGALHTGGQASLFETFTIEARGGTLTVDNFTIPEPSTALLGGFGLLGLLRRRRA